MSLDEPTLEELREAAEERLSEELDVVDVLLPWLEDQEPES